MLVSSLSMNELFWSAVGLVLILEGFMPFLLPKVWRRFMLHIITQSDNALRRFGLVSMVVGLGILYFLRR
jgi:uncharacterized protein YjeT (DUF2065 family)